MTRSLIIFGQGILRAHPILREEIVAAENAKTSKMALRQFDHLFFQHVGLTLRSLVCSVFYSLGGGRLSAQPVSLLRTEMRNITRFANALALFSDLALLKLGKSLKERESLSARLGDVLSFLFMAMNVVKQFHDRGQLEGEYAFARWSIEYCLYQAGQSLTQFITNFPGKWSVRLLRCLAFPFGVPVIYPRDNLNAAIVEGLSTPTAVREFLTSTCYVGGADHALGRVVVAWQAVLAAQPLFDKVKDAVQAGHVQRQLTRVETFTEALAQDQLTRLEYDQLVSAEKLRDAALAVDEFAFEDLVGFNADVLARSEINLS